MEPAPSHYNVMLRHIFFVEAHFFHSLSFGIINKGIKLWNFWGTSEGFVLGERNRREGGPLLGFLPLEDFSPGRRRRLEEEDGREEGSSSTRFVSLLPLSIFPSFDGCISSHNYVLVNFLMV